MLSGEEMRQLILDLETAELPQVCPHGQPVVIHLSQSALAKEFGRGVG